MILFEGRNNAVAPRKLSADEWGKRPTAFALWIEKMMQRRTNSAAVQSCKIESLKIFCFFVFVLFFFSLSFFSKTVQLEIWETSQRQKEVGENVLRYEINVFSLLEVMGPIDLLSDGKAHAHGH